MIDRIMAALSVRDWLRRGVDFLIAALLWRLPRRLRQALFAGTAHTCPSCHSQLRTFLNLHRPEMRWCPVCRSLQRHRLLALLLERRIRAERTTRRTLHLAPEAALAPQLRALSQQLYVSADRYDPRADLRLDLVRIPIADGALDLTLCSHVLEHIPDDRSAMREIARTLAPGGLAIILVPLRGEQTYEDPRITSPTERERAFGQFDHVRWYGRDIAERLREAGLAPRWLTVDDLATPEEQRRFCIAREQPILLCARQR